VEAVFISSADGGGGDEWAAQQQQQQERHLIQGTSAAQLALVRRVDQQRPEEESREIRSGVTASSFVEQKEEDICPWRQKDIRSPLCCSPHYSGSSTIVVLATLYKLYPPPPSSPPWAVPIVPTHTKKNCIHS